MSTARLHVDPFIQLGQALTQGSAQSYHFGSSVALSENGDTALISEGGKDAVWVFTRSGSKWTEQAELSAPDNEAVNLFGEHVALSADGNTALISDPGHQLGGGGCGPPGLEEPKYTEGAAWVFTRSGSTWSRAKGSPPAGRANEKDLAMGSASRSRATVRVALIGAPGNEKYRGAAWVFTRSGPRWSQRKAHRQPGRSVATLARSVALSPTATPR